MTGLQVEKWRRLPLPTEISYEYTEKRVVDSRQGMASLFEVLPLTPHSQAESRLPNVTEEFRSRLELDVLWTQQETGGSINDSSFLNQLSYHQFFKSYSATEN
jgi:hypothetical protein